MGYQLQALKAALMPLVIEPLKLHEYYMVNVDAVCAQFEERLKGKPLVCTFIFTKTHYRR